MKKPRGLELIDNLFGFTLPEFEDADEDYGFHYGYHYEPDEDLDEIDVTKDDWLD